MCMFVWNKEIINLSTKEGAYYITRNNIILGRLLVVKRNPNETLINFPFDNKLAMESTGQRISSQECVK